MADLFCGSGGTSEGAAAAAKARGLDVTLVAINHSEVAIATHSKNHPDATHLCENLETVNPRQVVRDCFGTQHLDLMVASPECFPGGTQILSVDGFIPIEEIKVGTKVLTHKGRWMPVTAVMSSVKDTCVVKGHGHFGLETTNEHPFYVRRRARSWNQPDRRWEFHYAAPEWLPSEELASNLNMGQSLYWGTPVVAEHVPVPDVGGRGVQFTEKFWWLVGRWLGDGTVRIRDINSEITICCGKHEAGALEKELNFSTPKGVRAQGGEYRWRRRDIRTVTLFETAHHGLANWLVEHFGRLAYGKTIPAWALTMPVAWRRGLLEGYLSADGWTDGQKVEASSISKRLAVGVRLLAESLGYRVALHRVKAPSNLIEGRKVNTKDQYKVVWVLHRKHEYGYVDEFHSWQAVGSVKPGRVGVTVYNISVAEDESYVADGIIVHNCTHHSNARGGKPMSEQSRSTAWCVLRWAEAIRIDNILIENVSEFTSWGPLSVHTRRPLKSKRGTLFHNFTNSLRLLGYQVDWRVLNAADYGDATTRRRLFIQARLGRRKVRWPEPTHAPRHVIEKMKTQPELFELPRAPWRSAKEIIDWSLEGESIFGRKRPLSPNTMARIYAGLEKYCGLPFILPHEGNHNGKSNDAHAVEDPIPQAFLVGIGGPRGGQRARTVEEPLPTVLAQNHHALIELQPYQVIFRNNATARDIDEPVPALCAGAEHVGLAEPRGFVFAMEHTTGASGHARRCYPLDNPIPVVTGRGSFGLIEEHAFLVQHFGERNGQTPRTRPVTSPTWTITAQGRMGLVRTKAFLMKYHGNHKGRTDGAGRVYNIEEPLRTVDTENRHALVELNPYFIKFFGGSDACSVADPLPSVTANYEHMGLVRPVLMRVRGEDGTEAEVEGRLVLDIRFRMLQPHELAKAMGFPDDYEFTGNRGQKVKQIGNAVAVNTARALVDCLLD